MSMSRRAKTIIDNVICVNNFSLQILQNMKLRLIIFKCFSSKNTARHDLDNIFTENVKDVTQYVNVVNNVNLDTIKRVL